MSEEFKPGLFRKPGQIGMYGSPEFRVTQNEAMDVLTGNKSWTEETKRDCLRIAKGETTADEVIDAFLKSEGYRSEV